MIDLSTPEGLQQMMERAPIARMRSDVPKKGFHWDVLWQTYFEDDESFRARVRAHRASFWSVKPVGI
jgi:hypothetical protein